MFLSRKWIFSIIVVTGISLLILLHIQFLWIRKSFERNRRDFDGRIVVAINTIRQVLREDGMWRTMNFSADAGSRTFFSSTQRSVGPGNHLQARIDSMLRSAGLPLTAGIVGTVGPLCYLMSDIPPAGHDLRFDHSAYKMCLCSNERPRALDIGFDLLPGKSLMDDSSSLIYPSLILVLLLIALFTYIFIVMQRQKALAVLRNDFINNLTHEFNTPLFSIGLTSKMLLRSTAIAQTDKLKQYVEIIMTEKARLQLQVDKILRLTAIESGSMIMEKEKVDIHHVLEECISVYQLIVSERSGSISLQAQATRSVVYGDRIHLFNALSNLIDNAIKYSSGSPEIAVLTSNTNEEITLEIRDRGIGIDPKDIKLIFNKFYRVKQGDRHDVKGFGIGLSYVKEVIGWHNGSIGVNSDPGVGSIFIIHLPILTD
jgi:signal transduction histidine kinase